MEKKKRKKIRMKYGKPIPITAGQPTAYNRKIAKYICEELSKGRTLTSICKEKNTPSIPTVYAWLGRFNPAFQEEFFKLYREAREIQAEVMADEIKDISDEIHNDDSVKVNRAKLRSDNRKWLAAHLLPRKFSDKMELTGAGGKDLIPSVPTKVVFNFIDKKETKEDE